MKVPTVRFEKVLRPTHLSHCRCSGVHECPISITSEPQSRKTRIPQPSAACLQPRPPQAEALWPKLQLFSFARLSMCTSIHRPTYLLACLLPYTIHPASHPSTNIDKYVQTNIGTCVYWYAENTSLHVSNPIRVGLHHPQSTRSFGQSCPARSHRSWSVFLGPVGTLAFRELERFEICFLKGNVMWFGFRLAAVATVRLQACPQGLAVVACHASSCISHARCSFGWKLLACIVV